MIREGHLHAELFSDENIANSLMWVYNNLSSG
jgi:hypothetical protein